MIDALAECLAIMGEYPPHVRFSMGTEISEESGEKFWFVSIREAAPDEGGWQNEGQLFRSVKGGLHWRLPVHPASRYEDASRVSVTAADPVACSRLALNMLRSCRGRFDIYPPVEETAPTLEELMSRPP